MILMSYPILTLGFYYKDVHQLTIPSIKTFFRNTQFFKHLLIAKGVCSDPDTSLPQNRFYP